MAKLLFVNAAKNYGSTGKIVEQIGLLAMNNGWDAKIVNAARFNRSGSIDSIFHGSVLSENAHAFVSFLFDNQGLLSIQTTKRLVKAIDDFHPDLINLHNIHGYYLNYPLFFQYISSINTPIVWTLHDCWSFTGHCSFFDIVHCEKWKSGCHHCNNLANYPKSIFLDRSTQNYQIKKGAFTSVKNLTLVPVSNWMGDLVKDSFLGHYPIHIIHNGIDLDVFRPRKNTLREKLSLENKFCILGVSNNGFSGRKGFDDFIELSTLLPSSFQIIMVGLHPDELKRIPSTIIGINRTDSVEELAEYYSAADVFINPTYSDNYPTTNLESIACGTPVITYNTGGSPEAINEKTGMVVPQGDVNALASAIVSLKEHNLSSKKCREYAEMNFNKDNCFKEYLRLFESLLT